MPLKAYEEFAQEPLAFPIGGKVYTVPPLGFTDGIRLQRIIAGEDDSLNDAPPEDCWKLILGGAWDEMVADGVPVDAITRAGYAAVTDFQFGRATAERVWEAGLDPKDLVEAVKAARKELDKDSKQSSSMGAASGTRKRASSTGTSSPKTTKRTAAKGKRSGS